MDDGKPNLTTETRRHGEDQEVQIMIPTFNLTSCNSLSVSLCPLRLMLISFGGRNFGDLRFDDLCFHDLCFNDLLVWLHLLRVTGNSCRIGVSS
jgi:hypothetical protein